MVPQAQSQTGFTPSSSAPRIELRDIARDAASSSDLLQFRGARRRREWGGGGRQEGSQPRNKNASRSLERLTDDESHRLRARERLDVFAGR